MRQKKKKEGREKERGMGVWEKYEGGRKKGRNLHEGNQTINLREAEPWNDVLSTCADGYWTIKTHFLFLNQKRSLMKCRLFCAYARVIWGWQRKCLANLCASCGLQNPEIFVVIHYFSPHKRTLQFPLNSVFDQLMKKSSVYSETQLKPHLDLLTVLALTEQITYHLRGVRICFFEDSYPPTSSIDSLKNHSI